jgi:hypothetical protein
MIQDYNLPVVMCRCEIWSLKLREQCRLKVFENRVLRRICGPNKDEVTGEWRKLHNAEFYDLYSTPNIIWVIKSRRMRWVGHVAHVGDRRGAYRVLVGRLEGKRPLQRLRHGWDENIKMDIQEVGWSGMDINDLVWNKDRGWAVVNVVMNHQIYRPEAHISIS